MGVISALSTLLVRVSRVHRQRSDHADILTPTSASSTLPGESWSAAAVSSRPGWPTVMPLLKRVPELGNSHKHFGRIP